MVFEVRSGWVAKQVEKRGGGEEGSARAVLVASVGVLCESCGLCGVVDQRGVCVQALRHLVTDDVHETLKHGFHVDVLFGGRLEELQA